MESKRDEKNRPDLAVCILFYERVEQTIECVKSFLPSKAKIYIFNNGSTAPARKMLGEFCQKFGQVKIFDSEKNLGVSVGRNYLINHTTEEWLFFVDSDIVVKTSDWLEMFAGLAAGHKEDEVFIPKMFRADENRVSTYHSIRQEGFKILYGEKSVDKTNNCFPGGASIVNRALFGRVGLYDEKMFVGFEDFELCIRALLSGKPVKARLIDGIEIVHDHRKPKKEEDLTSIKVRYDGGHIKNSFDRITEKHKVIFENNWEKWVDEQVGMLSNKGRLSPEGILRRVLPAKAQRLLMRTMAGWAVPTKCSLFMTDKCNFKCKGCYRSKVATNKTNEMGLEPIKKLLSLYPSIRGFTVAGLGEPTMCSNFVEIVNFLKKRRKVVGIITNGTNPNPLLELAQEPNYLSISLNGYDNKSYVKYTGTASYNKVIDTFFRARDKIGNVGFSYILNRENYQDLDKVLPLLDELKPKFVYLLNYLVYNPTVKEEVQKIITSKDRKIIDYIDESCNGRDYIKLKPTYIDFENPKFSCKSYGSVINLDPDGNIGGCRRQIPPSKSFGNLFEDRFPYNTAKMRRCRYLMHKKAYIHGECRFCFGNWK